jgi:hypothetical protein
LGIAAEVFHDALGLRTIGVAEVRGEPIVTGQPHVVRSGNDHVGDHPAFQAGHPVGQHPGWDPVDRNSDPEHPVVATDIDRRLLLRIAITRGQLPWTRILIDAGLADNGIRLLRGTILKAVDGHLCLSMQEKAVDDFLHQHGIDHTREPLYPFDGQLNANTRRRADWLLSDGTFVEMWGMPNDPGCAEKIELAARHRLRLVGLTSADVGRLSEIFAEWG